MKSNITNNLTLVSDAEIRNYAQDIANSEGSRLACKSADKLDTPFMICFIKNADDCVESINDRVNAVLKWKVFDEEEITTLESISLVAIGHAYNTVNLCHLFKAESLGYNIKTPVELRGMLKDYLKFISKVLPNKNFGTVVFRSNVRKDVYVNAHATELTMILINLITNGLKHGHTDSKRVDVILNRVCNNTKAAITVLDYGTGIDVEKINRMMKDKVDKLLNGDDSERPYKGVGLLACQKLAEKMGAQICMSNHPDAGAVFTILLDTTEDKKVDLTVLGDAERMESEKEKLDLYNKKLIYMALSNMLLDE